MISTPRNGPRSSFSSFTRTAVMRLSDRQIGGDALGERLDQIDMSGARQIGDAVDDVGIGWHFDHLVVEAEDVAGRAALRP